MMKEIKEESIHLGIAVIVGVVGFILFFGIGNSLPATNFQEGSLPLELGSENFDNYQNAKYRFGFSYPSSPDGYTIITQSEGVEGEAKFLISLVKPQTSEPVLTLGDGINVRVYESIGKDLISFLEETPESDFDKKFNDYQQGQIAGRNGIWYQVGGENLRDILAISHDGNVIIFTANYNSINSPVGKDFLSIIGSLRFGDNLDLETNQN